jgi:hypothetical protein
MVTVGRDGVWLHFGKYSVIHVQNVLGSKIGSNIICDQISNWVMDREDQARQMPGEMG